MPDRYCQTNARAKQLAEAAGLGAQFVADLRQFPFGLGLAVDLRQDRQGLGVVCRPSPASEDFRARITSRP